MKARLFGRLALSLCAAALYSSAFADAWFDAGISTYDSWPTDGSNKIVEGQGTWSGTEYATYEDARLNVSSGSLDESLGFDPAVHKTPQTAPLTYSISMTFTAADGLPDAELDVRSGISVFVDELGATNYCAYVKKQEGEGSEWVPLSGTNAVPAVATEITLALKTENGHSYIQFSAGGVVLSHNDEEWLEIVDTSEMTGQVSFVGEGTVSAMSATSGAPAVMKTLQIPALEHVTVLSVKVAGLAVTPDGSGNYVVEQGSVVTVAFAPESGWALDVASMTFVVNDDMTLPDAGRPTPVNVAATVTINEIMAKNGSTLTTSTGFEGLDWVELYNSGDIDVDLTGWYMGNDPTKKVSKWPQIQGSCVVPAKGYKIVWFDGDELCSDWAADEAHVAANISTDAGKHTVFLASAADTSTIVQQITLPGGVKDVSYGRGHLSRTLVSSTSPAEYKVGEGEWQSVDGPVGMAGTAGSFTVVGYQINKSIGNMDVADACIVDPSTWSKAPATNTSATVAFRKSDATVGFDTSLYSNFPGVSGNYFICVVTGTVTIPEDGDWTFDVGSDDGFSAKLTRLGSSWGWESRGTRGYAHSTATFNLAAGAYAVEIAYFNATGAYSLDFSAAKGRIDSFSASTFKLVGSGDGLAHAGPLGSQIAADVSSEMLGNTTTLDWRTSFYLDESPHSGDVFRLLVKYADGFTATLNGKQVATAAASGARSAASALQAQTFLIDAADVVAGTNTLAITAENDAVSDTAMYLSAELVRDMAEDMMVYFPTPTPGAVNAGSGRTGFTPPVTFSEAHGWKDAAFDLTLTCSNNTSAIIYYTLNGSSPKIGDPATFRYTEPIHVDKTTVVRAAVPDVDSILQTDSSATYLFYDDVIAQDSSVPAGFPANAAVNSQKMLYGLSTTVTQGDADTQARLRRGFTENTRTVSLVIDPKNLFDKTSGIYVNATGNGRSWERQTMVEQINPMDSTDEFTVPAGLRIRGAFSRGSGYPKHSFRLFFRSEYGMGTLEHPLFGDEGASEFEKIDFRTSQNYSWANNDNADTFIHECFSRDTEGAMGKTYNRSRYYHLFINGVYWGLYQTEERVDDNYAASYNGGAADNYDVVRTSQPGYNTGVVEGEDAAWTELWRITMQEGYGTGYEDNYNKVLGLNPDGTRNPAYPILLNVTNLIEFILTAHYSEDADSPVNSNGMANNIIAFRNRNDGEGKLDGFLWNRHDAEHSLGLGSGGDYTKVYTVTYGTPEHSTSRDLTALGNFNPNMLHYKLMTNATYRATFADLVYKHLVKEGGALTAPVAEARYRARMAEIDDAVVCESARWGYQYSSARTRQTWLSSCNDRITFIKNRVPYLIAEYQRRGWYPSVDAPVAQNGSGSSLADGTVVATDDMVYLTGGSAGTVYYTLDGSDPSAADGTVATGAIAYSGAVPAPVDVPVIAKGDEWKYSDKGAKPADNWTAAAYDDSAWKFGASCLGFASSGTFGTTLAKYVGGGSSGTQVVTYYFRKTFTMPAGAEYLTELKAALDCDDGYIAYINGVEVSRDQVGSSEYSDFTMATNMGEKDATFSFPAGTLVEGENVIAVEVHQCGATSSDAWWNLALSYAVAGEVEGGISVPPEGLTITARVLTQSGEWSALSEITVKGEMPQATAVEGLRLAEAMTSASDADGGNAGDYLVVTNIAAGEVVLDGVKIVAWNAKGKTEADASLTYVFGTGTSLMPGATLKIDASMFPTGGKITNSKVGIRIYDASEKLVQDIIVDADWWSSACDGTGASFIARQFVYEVKESTQWRPSHYVDWPENPETEIADETTAADLGITNGAFVASAPAELRKLATWAKAKGVTFASAQVQEMAFDANGNPLTMPAAAYLLACEPTEEKVAEAKSEFKFTKIVPGTTPSIDGTGLNGTVTIQGVDNLGDEWGEVGANTRFYRAILTR